MLRDQHIDKSRFSIKKLEKIFGKNEGFLLKQLIYWSEHSKKYGIEKDGRTWIYNTLDQWANMLDVSKSSVRRAIKSLKDKNLISCEYLSPNKRNRTLYYAVNVDGINEYLSKINIRPCVQKANISDRLNEHMNEHMYIVDNSKQNINKSYKSEKNNSKKNLDQTSIEKPTIIPVMIKIWEEEFSESKIQLSKNLARFLVAAFKTKFKSCLKEWKRYLKTLKTSAYLMSDKFKLSIWWVVKFITIDRIRAGELGAKPDSVLSDSSDMLEKANKHIESVQESEICKDFRKKIVEILDPSTYVSWFTNVDFVMQNEKIIMKAHNTFVEDWIIRNFNDKCRLCVE